MPTPAVLITIGDELLIGQVIDTNSAYIAQALNREGIDVVQRLAIGDERQAITDALDHALNLAKVVIITGGLGPTADDITKPTLAAYFNSMLERHEPTVNHLRVLFEQVLKRPLTERNLTQALLPSKCDVLFNRMGTAPGMLFRKDDAFVFSLPGVPVEMQGLMTDEVLPRLKTAFPNQAVLHETLMTAGIGESFLADRIQDFEQRLPPFVRLAYLPNFGMVRLRLTARGRGEEAVEQELKRQFALLKEQVADVMITDRDETVPQLVHRLLIEHQKKLVTAESCTGGYIASQLTALPGSSVYFLGGAVAYSNIMKEQLLGVNTGTIAGHGAVSEAVVKEMAEGARSRFGSDYAVAVSGVMGPDGGTAEKPVGFVWVAVAGPSGTRTQSFKFRFSRQKNIEQTAMQALNLLRAMIVDDVAG